MSQPQNGAAPPTQRELAKMLNVGLATVSMALRDDPRISRARRRQIQAAARKAGYVPNPNAAALSHMRHPPTGDSVRAALAWVNLWPHADDLRQYAEFKGYWRGAVAAAQKFGYRLEEFHAGDADQIHRMESVLLARGINGLLIAPYGGIQPTWGDFDWNHFSVIRIGRSSLDPACHVVTADQLSDAALAFHEMRARGYERIGMVSSGISYHLFEAGYIHAQQFVPARQRLSVFRFSTPSPWDDLKMLQRWLKAEKPDAVFTAVPIMGEILKACGRRVPQDIGLAVTSILDAGADSGIDQHAEEIGRVAVLSLISLIHDNDRGIPPIPREILIKGRWVNGSSLPPR